MSQNEKKPVGQYSKPSKHRGTVLPALGASIFIARNRPIKFYLIEQLLAKKLTDGRSPTDSRFTS